LFAERAVESRDVIVGRAEVVVSSNIVQSGVVKRLDCVNRAIFISGEQGNATNE
jgi:hypothetical protein